MRRNFFIRFQLRDAWLLLTVISTLFGMQLTRVFFSSLAWPFDRDTTLLLSLSWTPFLVFSLPLLILIATRYLRLEKLLISVVVLQASMRLFEQINTNPRLDFLLASLGLVGFGLYFPVAFKFIRGSRDTSGLAIAIGIMLGLSLDTALRSLLWTLDVSWQPGWRPIITISGLVVLQIVVAHYLRLSTPLSEPSPRMITALSAFGLGPFFYLAHIEYQNITELFFRSGWQFNVVVVAVLVSNFIGIMLSIFFNSQPPGRRTRIFIVAQIVMLAGLILGWYVWDGSVYLIAICLSGIAASVILGFVSRSLLEDISTVHPGYGRFAHGVGFIIFLLLALMYYILQTSMLVSIIGAFILMVTSIGRMHSQTPREHQLHLLLQPEPVSRIPLMLLVLLIIGTSIWIYENDTDSAVRFGMPDEIRVMTLNAHQGFDALGGIGITRQTELIQNEKVDVVAISEASRGWLFNGMVDTLLWMSHELGYEYVYGPEIEFVTGNAFVSRYQMSVQEIGVFAAQNFPVTSGFLRVHLFEAQKPIQLISAHLAWGDDPDDIEVRSQEVSELFEMLDPGIPTIILGDMNMRPHEPGYALIKAAGFRDWVSEYHPGENYTFNTMGLYKRVDYIFVTPQIYIHSMNNLPVTVSDHLPVLGKLCLKNCENAH
jgi:endonuclease/exonuclease/phosphatase family metal-dependent hydrolase